jgi:hypothetical protein
MLKELIDYKTIIKIKLEQDYKENKWNIWKRKNSKHF